MEKHSPKKYVLLEWLPKQSSKYILGYDIFWVLETDEARVKQKRRKSGEIREKIANEGKIFGFWMNFLPGG